MPNFENSSSFLSAETVSYMEENLEYNFKYSEASLSPILRDHMWISICIWPCHVATVNQEIIEKFLTIKISTQQIFVAGIIDKKFLMNIGELHINICIAIDI